MTDALAVDAAPVGPAFDLLAAYEAPGGFFFERGGTGVAGSGAAARIRVAAGTDQVRRGAAEARELLAVFAGRAPEALPLVVGAFPFAADRDADLTVPSVAVTRRRAGGGTRVRVADANEPADLSAPERPAVRTGPRGVFTEPQLEVRPSRDEFASAVRAVTGRIRAGDLRKVVLARTILVRAGRPLDPKLLVHRLRAVDPVAYAFAVPSGPFVLVGASPELLVSRSGTLVRCNPLAGSAPRAGDPEEDEAIARALAASSKDREEHEIVVDAIAATLSPLCVELAWDPEPVLLETANVWHLSTRFRGRLREPAPNALDLVAALHPTPAVAGEPRTEALDEIRRHEPFSRGLYSGPVGWMDAGGDGEWAIALRCAELDGDRALLYAGAGIVADSNPDRELDETERKFRAFLDALRWG